MQNRDKQLAIFADTEHWKVLRKTMEDIAKFYYGWDAPNEEMLVRKGAHLFLRDVIRKVEGSRETQ